MTLGFQPAFHPSAFNPPALPWQVATKAYLRGGKDGFECLKSATILMDGETAPRLATLVQVRPMHSCALPSVVPVAASGYSGLYAARVKRPILPSQILLCLQ